MNTGIVSLLNDHCIGCVLDGGRVSLAQIMEFSHFVDLYVLEDRVLVPSAIKEVYFAKLDADKISPLVEHEDERNSFVDSLYHVSFYGRIIYDAAPVNYTFSFGSYEYWTGLSEAERKSIPSHLPREYLGRDYLLSASRGLDESITECLEELARTKLTLMPSSLTLIPFLQAFHQMDTPALYLYRKATQAHRKAMEDILALTRPRMVYLPPLLLTLLSRCNKQTDIPTRLIELRGEFSDFRSSVAKWLSRLDSAEVMKDKLEIRAELDETLRAATEGLENRRFAFYKEAAYLLLEAAGEGDLKKAIAKPAIAATKKALDRWGPDLLATRRFTGFVDLLDNAVNVSDYATILDRVFGKNLDISQAQITEAKRYRHYILNSYSFDTPIPG